MGFIQSLTSLGTDLTESASERRSIYLANTLSLVIALVGYLMSIIYFLWYGQSVISAAIPIIATISLAPLFFNYTNSTTVSRFWICLFIPISVTALSVYSKIIYYYRQEELDYFTFRIVILCCGIFPPIFFSVKEKVSLIFASLSILFILLLHDPLYNYFDVPYRAQGMRKSNYDFINIIVFFMYLLTTGTVIFMKWVSDENEATAQKLIGELNLSNQKLSEQNNEIEQQNQEIIRYSDNLDVNRKKLSDAYKIIEEQRNLLFVQNKNLSTELLEKNNELTETNNELIKHNNELRQFSYTVSHNLRGPVASLMGLLKLFDSSGLEEDNREIFYHIENSTLRLDAIIKDLSKIIDIRNDIFQIRQQIDLAHEISEVLVGLNREIVTHHIRVVTNVNQSGIVYSVRPMVHSIIYNLVSNAIKYRSQERNSLIEITTSEETNFYIITVRDNGLGIDLSRDKENLFKLYKRFHHHIEGKGLGLYLVKLQAEALGGTITVESELNRFTTFTVRLRKPENADRQVLLAEEMSELFFDATLNCIGIVCKKPVADPITVLRKIVEFIKVYNTPNYMADLSAISANDPNNHDIFVSYIISETVSSGLKRVAIVSTATDSHPSNQEELSGEYETSVSHFSNVNSAVKWIQEQNKI